MGAKSLSLAGLALLLAAPWPYGCAYDEGPYALAAALLLVAALAALGAARSGRGLPETAGPVLAFCSLAFLQVVAGTTAAATLTAEALLVFAGIASALVFWSDRARDHRTMALAAGAVFTACALQGLFGAVQWSIAPHKVYGEPTDYFSFGSYINHNHFAGFVGAGVPLALGVAVGHWRRAGGPTPAVIGFGGLALGLASAVLASRSRGGAVGLAGGLAVLTVLCASWIAPRRRRGAAWAVAGAAAVAVVLLGLVMVPATTRQHLATTLRGPVDGSGAFRVDVWRDTLRLAAAHPIAGAGLGTYRDAFAAVKQGHGDLLVHHAENDLLELASETGVAGLGIAVWLAWVVFRGYRDRMTSGHDPVRKGLATGALAGASGLLTASLFNFNLHVPANALLCAALLGVAGAPRSEPKSLGGPGLAWCIAAVLAGLAAAAGWRTAGAWELRRAFQEDEPHRLVAAMDGVARRHPYLAEALRTRGNAWRRLAHDAGPLSGDRLARAESDLAAAVVLRPRWGDPWADLAWVRYRRGDVEAAHAAHDRAVDCDPSGLAVGRSHALFLYRTRGTSAGVAALRRVLERNGLWSVERLMEETRRWSSDPAHAEEVRSAADLK